MGNFKKEYESLWNRLRGKADAPQIAVGGDFKAMGKLEFALLRQFGLKPDWSVIDVGCGSGRLAVQLRDWLTGAYLGTDILPGLLDHARRLCPNPVWRFVPTDGQAIPAGDESADLICFFSVFTHISQLEAWRYVLESKRVLRPGGILVISFLEFRIRSHWAIFREDAKDNVPGMLNQFTGRDAFDAFAYNAGLESVTFLDGDEPNIPIAGEVRFEDGRAVSGMANLGQSTCVLRKPLTPLPLPL